MNERPEQRVSDAELESWGRAGMLTDCAKDLQDARARIAELEAERDALAAEASAA